MSYNVGFYLIDDILKLLYNLYYYIGGGDVVKCRLRVLLAEHETTQAELSEQIGIQPMTISKATRNELKQIPVALINGCCKYFNCQPSDIWQYIPDTPD